MSRAENIRKYIMEKRIEGGSVKKYITSHQNADAFKHKFSKKPDAFCLHNTKIFQILFEQPLAVNDSNIKKIIVEYDTVILYVFNDDMQTDMKIICSNTIGLTRGYERLHVLYPKVRRLKLK